MKRLHAAVLSLLAFTWLSLEREAGAQQPPPPKQRVVLNNLFVLRFNPVGLEDQIRLGWQERMSDQSHPLFRDNFLFMGIAPRINPAFIKIGPSIEIQPLSLFNLRVGLEYIHFFSTFGFFFSSKNSISSDRSRTPMQMHESARLKSGHVCARPLPST